MTRPLPALLKLNTEHAKRESQTQRAQRERARQQATKDERRRKLTAQEQVRQLGAEGDAGLETDGHRVLVEEGAHAGAGEDRSKKRTRVLTRADALQRRGFINDDEWQAAEALRNMVMRQLGRSEGVARYGDDRSTGDPWRKADLKAVAILRKNRSELRALADFLFAMVGLHDENDNKVFDQERALVLIRAAVETANTVELTEIGKLCTNYTGEKQLSAGGGAVLKELLRRGALHLGLVKGTMWDPKMRWLPK